MTKENLKSSQKNPIPSKKSSTGSTSKPEYTAPAPTLAEIQAKIKEDKPPSEITPGLPETPKRGRGRPPGSGGKKSQPDLTQIDVSVSPELIEIMMMVVVNILNSAMKTDVWAFRNDDEKNNFCLAVSKYANLRAPDFLKKFAPEVALAIVLGGYIVPRIVMIAPQEKQKPAEPKEEKST